MFDTNSKLKKGDPQFNLELATSVNILKQNHKMVSLNSKSVSGSNKINISNSGSGSSSNLEGEGDTLNKQRTEESSAENRSSVISKEV